VIGEGVDINALSMWPVPLAQVLVTTSSTDFSFQNLVFFENLFEFLVAKITLKINISHFLNPKSYQINSIKPCSSRSFQQHQRHIPIPPKNKIKSVTISFNFQ
jgi:hypothetical protein